MLPEMPNLDEQELESETVGNDKALVEQQGQAVSLGEYTVDKIKARVDENKSFEEQVEDFAAVQATMAALKDEGTQDILTQQKKSQLIDNADVKVKKAKEQVIQAETEIQKAKREKYQLLFDTFGVSDHIPDWLLKVLMVIFVPPYVLFVLFIGVPTGLVRYTTDCIDGILVRYDKADPAHKPKIKVTVWVLLVLIVVGAICLTTLGCLHII